MPFSVWVSINRLPSRDKLDLIAGGNKIQIENGLRPLPSTNSVPVEWRRMACSEVESCSERLDGKKLRSHLLIDAAQAILRL